MKRTEIARQSGPHDCAVTLYWEDQIEINHAGEVVAEHKVLPELDVRFGDLAVRIPIGSGELGSLLHLFGER